MDRSALESLLKDKAKAPRVTVKDVEDAISSVHYFTARQGVEGTYVGGVDDECVEDAQHLKLLTFCIIVVKNGFTFVGQSACASPENFDPEVGQKIAYDDAFNQIWIPLGYMLKQALYEQANPTPPQETTWQQRLQSEAVELSAKIEKLKNAIDGDKIQGIDKTLLIQQKSVMLEYLEILTDRMMRAGLV